MGSPKKFAPQKPTWLQDIADVKHIAGEVWEIPLTSYGRVFVGAYSDCLRYVKEHRLGLHCHHIVGVEHLNDVKTGYTESRAPAVALDEKTHAALSDAITKEQRWLGGRHGGRSKVTKQELRSLYHSVYTWFTAFEELSVIAKHILGPGATKLPARILTSVVVVAGRVGGRALSASVDILFTWLDAREMASSLVAQLRSDLSNLIPQLSRQINLEKDRLLAMEGNQKMFAASPFKEYWYEIKTLLTLDSTSEPFRYTGISLVSVSIVTNSGRGGLGKVARVGDPQEYIEYHPVFEKLKPGERLAADGYPLRVIDASHGIATEERLSMIADYVAFARRYPQLHRQYADAWQQFSRELCLAGYTDLFSDVEIGSCRALQRAEEAAKARGLQVLPPWLSRPN